MDFFFNLDMSYLRYGITAQLNIEFKGMFIYKLRTLSPVIHGPSLNHNQILQESACQSNIFDYLILEVLNVVSVHFYLDSSHVTRSTAKMD